MKRVTPFRMIAALAALAGLGTPANLPPMNAAQAASCKSPWCFYNEGSTEMAARLLLASVRRAGRMFRHFDLNQRQRRKLNRQRHAAGVKRAFA